MAYVDQNGLVLIDEVEAAEDIKKLKNALASMEDALDLVNQIAGVNSAFSGDTAGAIEVSSTELLQQLNQQKASIEEEIQFINDIVEKYQTIDAKMKNQVNSTL